MATNDEESTTRLDAVRRTAKRLLAGEPCTGRTPLFLAPVAYRIMAPFSKPRAEETRLLIEELKTAPR